MKREDLEAREFGLIIASSNFPFYAAPEADAVMDAMEARIKELEESQAKVLALGVSGGLRLRIKELESQLPKWISVKDSLPTKGQNVLVARNHRSLYPIDVVCWSEDYITHDIATHWMPLPPPPTTEEK